MKRVLAILPLLAGVAVTPAHAQFGGYSARAEVRAGYDEVRTTFSVFDEAFTEAFSERDLAYGFEVGADIHLSDAALVGVYGGVDFSDASGCNGDVIFDGDEACIDAGTNYMAGIRAGVQTGDLGLIYGKLGLSRGTFKASYTDDFGDLIFADKDTDKGWHAGAGFELGVTRNIYFKGEYLHHWYDDLFSDELEAPDGAKIRRHQLMAGVGFRFGGLAPEPAPPPPPPPPPPPMAAPATQTCPDGSVILATDVCPLPPPPPPPPPPPASGERG